MKDTVEFGKKIKELRLINDFSLRDLESESGISYSFISSIEKGRFSPSRETVIALVGSLKGANKNELLMLAGFAPQQNDHDTLTSTHGSGTQEEANRIMKILGSLPEELREDFIEQINILAEIIVRKKQTNGHN